MCFLIKIFGKSKCKLPDAAVRQLRVKVDEYERLAQKNKENNEKIEKIKSKCEKGDVWWSDFAQVECCIVNLLKGEELRASIHGWRRRMREVVGRSRYDQYMMTSSNANDKNASEEKIRADIITCIKAIFYFYGNYGAAAESRSCVTKKTMIMASVILIFELLIVMLFACDKKILCFDITDNMHSVVKYILATSAAAVAGSVVSVQRRLEDPEMDVDPCFRYIQVSSDQFSVYFISPVFGACFGLVLYTLVVAHFFPYLTINFSNGIPCDSSSFALLLLLGFISGFGEGLIPDALNRITAQTRLM